MNRFPSFPALPTTRADVDKLRVSFREKVALWLLDLSRFPWHTTAKPCANALRAINWG